MNESYYQTPLHASMNQPHILSLPEEIRSTWRCAHCLVFAIDVVPSH
jgi:hypothetical protein